MRHPWPQLKWWDCGERQVVEEKIDDLQADGVVCNPPKPKLYQALRNVPQADVRVMVVGQDPYPTPGFATGSAFSVPETLSPENFPSTLNIIFKEYCSDLHYELPNSGSLNKWEQQGVLLWNAIPSVQAGSPLSNDWGEWEYLTGEIIDSLRSKGIVFVFLGAVARRYASRVDSADNCRVILTSHPSPRGNMNSRTPFTGSRMFSEVNRHLNDLGLDTINWRLDNVPDSKGSVSQSNLVGGDVLQNVTGADLGRPKRKGLSPNVYRPVNDLSSPTQEVS